MIAANTIYGSQYDPLARLAVLPQHGPISKHTG
jgi:hypothetical protein